MNKVGVLPRCRGYCATCGRDFGEANPEYRGCRIECGENHLAKVISGDTAAEWWLRREEWLLNWQTKYSPFPSFKKLLRYLGLLKNLQAGWFLIGYFVVIGVALLVEENRPPAA